MKKVAIATLLIIVALLIVPIFSFAQTKEDPSTNSAGASTELSRMSSLQANSEQEKVEYSLPYHGMLPDSPLYFLKTFRDRLITTFISDPLKKAEFDLLSADKRLSAGIALFEKGKKDLSESTISKGENYFEDGIKNLELAKKQGRDVGGLLANMELSAEKHLEILKDFKNKTKGNLLKKFEILEKRVQEFEGKVKVLKPQ